MVRQRIKSESELETLLSEPGEELVELFRHLDGDIIVLGIGGKIGPSLGATAVRAARRSGRERKVYGVSRFRDLAIAAKVRESGVEPIVCDLLDERQLGTLPQCRNVVFMAGRKFGTVGTEETTWAMNVIVPAQVARSFPRSRIVVFSTGCVYPLVEPASGGCGEEDPPGPVGEYASSCLGRERAFEFYSHENGTEVVILRLNYAIDLRYGVLYDVASRVFNDEPVPLSVPFVNVIWQGDVNNLALRALSLCSSPPEILNLTGAQTLSVRALAEQFGELFGKKPRFGPESRDLSLLSNSKKAASLLPYEPVPLNRMIEWTADWIAQGGRGLGKPTHFERSDGEF